MKRISSRTELRVIATILDSKNAARNKMLGSVRVDHFGHEPAKECFERIHAYIRANKPIPRSRVLAEDPAISKAARKWLKSGMSGKSARHPAALTTTRSIPSVLEKLETYRRQRHFYEIGSLAAEEISKDNPDHDLLASEVEEKLMQIRSSTGAEMVHAGHGGNDKRLFNSILDDENPLELVKTGWKTFDEETGGFARTNLIFLAANYGGGKSVCGMQLGLNMYRQGYNVLWVSLEMDEGEAWERIWSNVSGVEHDAIRRRKLTSKQKRQLEKARKDFTKHGRSRKCRFSTYHPGYIDPWQLVSEVRGYNFDVLIVDYISLLRPPPGTPNEERIQLGEIAKALKIAAGKRYLNCVMIVEAQLNDDNRLKYSRAMAEHANNVLWWRMDDRARERGEVVVHQDKARNSRLYDFFLRFQFELMTMVDGGLADGNHQSGQTSERTGKKGFGKYSGKKQSSDSHSEAREVAKKRKKRKEGESSKDTKKAKRSKRTRSRGVMPELTSM